VARGQTVQTTNNVDWNSSFPSTPTASGTYITASGLATTPPGTADPVGVDYSTTIRSIDKSGTNSFDGGTLIVAGDTRLLLKQNPGDTASANLVLDDQSNTVLATTVAGTSYLAGAIEVPSNANAYLGLNNGAATNLTVVSTLTGSGTLSLGISGSVASENLTFTGNMSGFSGTINIYTAGNFSIDTSTLTSGTLEFTSTAGTLTLTGTLYLAALQVGSTTVPAGTYSASQLNALTSTSLFTGSGSVGVQTVQTTTNVDWNSAFPSTPVASGTYVTAPGLATTPPGVADSVGVDYSTTIRSTDNGGTNSFDGGALIIAGDTRLLLKQGPGDTASANLVLENQSNTVLATGDAGTAYLTGTIDVPSNANAYLGVNNFTATTLSVGSTLIGSGTLNLGCGDTPTSQSLNLTGNMSGFTGTINVYSAGNFSIDTNTFTKGTLQFTNTARTSGTFTLTGTVYLGALQVGGTTVATGTYSASQLNALTNTSLFTGSGLAGVEVPPPPPVQVTDGRVTLSMASSGYYGVASTVTGWSFYGTLPSAPTQVATSSGSDSIGSFQQISFSWLDASSRSMTGYMNLYSGQDVIVFSDTMAAASATAPSPFPNFTAIPAFSYQFCYLNGYNNGTSDWAPPSFGTLQSNLYAEPWLFFDASEDAMIISPASHFLPAAMIGNGTSEIASGFNSTVANIPAGYGQKTIMAVSTGINHTFNAWGEALTNLYGKTRPAYDADTLLRYYGYWTDHYATYYYDYDNASTSPSSTQYYALTLENLVASFTQSNIPIHYMQLDSWAYDKSAYSYSDSYGSSPNAPGFSNLPSQPWNLFGGELLWAGDADLFPSGELAFSQALGANGSNQSRIPLVCHARWIDPNPAHGGTYAQNPTYYGISGICCTSTNFWNSLASYAAANNIEVYEQDWQEEIVTNSPALSTTGTLGDQWLGNMSAAFAAQGVDIQYCLPIAATLLQASEYNNVTTTRASDDGFNPSYYHNFIYTSRLAYSMGIWPWTDVYSSTQTYDLLLGNLSAGPVGTGDAIGSQKEANLLLAIRADGVIVKPDAPLVPTDGAFVTEAVAGQNNGPPLIASTTSSNGVITTYAVAIPQSNSSATTTGTFSMSDLGISGSAYFYNYFTGSATEVSPGGTVTEQVAPLTSGSFPYFIIAPIGKSGIAFLGDLGKFVSNGRKRISSVTDQPGELVATVLFAPAEHQITLHGYSSVAPLVSVQSGSASAVSYNAATGHFTVAVTVSGTAAYNNDIDPARPVIVTFSTAYPAWQNTEFGANASNPAIAGETANPAGDGPSNLMKYALGMNPNVNSLSGLPLVTNSGSGLQMQFMRNLSATDVSYLVQTSDNLQTWTSVATLSPGAPNWTTDGSTVADDYGEVTITGIAAPPGGDEQFIRLMITQP
jgi:hypothetical protein